MVEDCPRHDTGARARPSALSRGYETRGHDGKRSPREEERGRRKDPGLSDDDRVLVSARFNGNEEAERHFLPYASRGLLDPQPGHPRPDPAFRKWHRENCFRGPEREV
jgi:hypothetical protein